MYVPVRHLTETAGWNATKDARRSSSSSIVILSYPQYCRYRAVQRRLETVRGGAENCVNDSILRAIGLPASIVRVTRVMFCRSTFCHPDLEEHEFRRDLLSTSPCLSFSAPIVQKTAQLGGRAPYRRSNQGTRGVAYVVSGGDPP